MCRGMNKEIEREGTVPSTNIHATGGTYFHGFSEKVKRKGKHETAKYAQKLRPFLWCP
jgi:hypothetical protein